MREGGARLPINPLIATALLGAILLLVVAPIGNVVIAAFTSPRSSTTGAVEFGWNPILFSQSLGWAALIAFLATLLALPCAWFAGRRGLWVTVLACVMLLLPTYMTSSGWGLIRAPGTMVGDMLEKLSEGDRRWIPIAVNRGIAVLGLSFWSTPLALLVIAASVRKIPQAVEDALRVDARSFPGVLIERIKMIAPGIAGGFAIVFLIMLGSAVPLHLAQVETYSTKLWLMLDESGQAERWKVWLSAWPVFLACTAGALLLARSFRHQPASTDSLDSAPRAPFRSIGFVVCLTVFTLGIVVPLVSFIISIHRLSSFSNVWAVSAPGIFSSLKVALATAICGTILASLVASRLAGPRIQTAALIGFGIMALVPGVLVGASTAALWRSGPRLISDSAAIVVLAHISRFGIIAILSGVFAARAETLSEQDSRRLDGGEGSKGWLLACLPWQWGMLVAGGIAMGALSLQEIEASVMVTPPGVESLAREMLQHLHFARTEELSVTSVLLISTGLIVAVLAAGLALWSVRVRGSWARSLQPPVREVGTMGGIGS